MTETRYSRIATVDCCFLLFQSRHHGVANLNDASFSSFNASANKLLNNTFTVSISVPRLGLFGLPLASWDS